LTGEWLDDVSGPDGVRVSFFVEPRLDKVFRGIDEYRSWSGGQLGPSLGRFLAGLLPGNKQEGLLKNAWRLVIESDTGKKIALVRPTHGDVLAAAQEIAAAIRVAGTGALDHLEDHDGGGLHDLGH
jgi:hypothetical protein